MKQSRRHELKTNELSLKLKELYEKANRYSTHILVAVLALLVVVVATNYMRTSRQSELEEASRELAAIRQLDPQSEEDDALARARSAAAKYGDLPGVGFNARDLYGRMAYQTATLLNPLDDSEEVVKLLKEAESVYTDATAELADEPVHLGQARLMLAKVKESLLIMGEGDKEAVRDLYAKLSEENSTVFKPIAEEALASLDERLIELKFVEPGSPETQPAKNPIPPDEDEIPDTSSVDIDISDLDVGDININDLGEAPQESPEGDEPFDGNDTSFEIGSPSDPEPSPDDSDVDSETTQ